MKILQVCAYYYPFLELGGPVVKVKAISERLVQKGHQVTVLTVDHDGRINPRQQDIAGVQVKYLRTLLKYRRTTINPSVLPFCITQLRHYDIVHIYGLYELSGPIVGMFSRLLGIPYVIEPLGQYTPHARNLYLKQLYLYGIGKVFANNAATLIATSKQEYEELTGDGIPPYKVILRRNGINMAEFSDLPNPGRFRKQFGIDPQKKIILYLGRLAAEKTPELLMEAFADYSCRQTILAFVGPDAGDGCTTHIKNMARQSGFDDSVIFTGPLYGSDKLESLVDADVLVLPSIMENFGNAVVEAMACGTPSIVTEGCGVSSYVKDRSGLVIPHNVHALSTAMRQMMSDSNMYANFKNQAPLVAKELSWDEPLQSMLQLYASLSSKSR